DEQINSNALLNDQSTIIAINILEFKKINKLIGELQANQMLSDFVKILQQSLLDVQHLIFNTYIDNFIIIFKNSWKVEQIENWFEELLSNVESQSELLGSNVYLDLR